MRWDDVFVWSILPEERARSTRTFPKISIGIRVVVFQNSRLPTHSLLYTKCSLLIPPTCLQVSVNCVLPYSLRSILPVSAEYGRPICFGQGQPAPAVRINTEVRASFEEIRKLRRSGVPCPVAPSLLLVSLRIWLVTYTRYTEQTSRSWIP